MLWDCWTSGWSQNNTFFNNQNAKFCIKKVLLAYWGNGLKRVFRKVFFTTDFLSLICLWFFLSSLWFLPSTTVSLHSRSGDTEKRVSLADHIHTAPDPVYIAIIYRSEFYMCWAHYSIFKHFYFTKNCWICATLLLFDCS